MHVRIGRAMWRHRRGIARAAAVLAIVALSAFAIQSYRKARELAGREHARQQLADFQRLADETQYFAANSDPIAERVPYYDPTRAMNAGRAALAIAAPWGDDFDLLPLTEARAEALQAHYGLLLTMARSALQGGEQPTDPHVALKLLDRAKSAQAPTRGYYELLSKSLSLLGERDPADRAAEHAKRAETPVRAQDHYLKAEMLRTQDVGAAGRVLTDEGELKRQYLTEAIEEYRRALALDPRHYWARFQYGRCLLALGRSAEAVETLSACVAMRPNSAWAYTARGLANALSNNNQGAVADLTKAIELDPTFQPARLNRGIAYWLNGETDAAETDFDAVLAAPDDKRLVEAALYRGQIFLSKKRPQEALEDFSTVVAARPNLRVAYWYRAHANFLSGNFDSGMADVKKYSALDPDPKADSRLVLGKALRKMGQQCAGRTRAQLLLGAAQQIQAAISADEATPELLEQLGAVQELLGDVPQALAIYSQAIKLAPASARLRNLRGWAHVGQKDYEKARDDFAEALKISPNDPNAHSGLGYALAELGQKDDARKEASAAWLGRSDAGSGDVASLFRSRIFGG
jgi:tetratricopeptide (TPR) repeat protein